MLVLTRNSRLWLNFAASGVLFLTGLITPHVHAAILYSFSGTTDTGLGQQFSYSSPYFISGVAAVPHSSLTSCSSPFGECSAGVIFNPNFTQSTFNGPRTNDAIFFGSHGNAYYFQPGAFSADGTYGNAMPGFLQVGTLTVSGTPDGPTLVTLANLSNDVYSGGSGNIGNFTSITTNCSTIPAQCSNSGFLAVAYATCFLVPCAPDKQQVVIAIRGTVLGDPLPFVKNALSDTSFISNTPSANLRTSVAFAAEFVQKIQQEFPAATITLTGHSLGGAIAQLVGEASGFTTAVFNAPGGALLYSQLSNELRPYLGVSGGSTNTNYRLAGDQVSLAGQPIGSTITFGDPSGTTFNLSNDLPKSVVENLATIVNLHLMPTVISQLNVAPSSSTADPNLVTTLEQMIQANSTILSLPFEEELRFLFDIADFATGYILDPTGGSDFILTEQPGSPYFSSIDLPTMSGVALYNFRYKVGNTWSAFQNIQPATQYFFGAGVDGIEFLPIDQLGNGVAMQGFLFDVTFGSVGTFSATFDEIQPTPEPASGYLVGIVAVPIIAIVASRVTRRRRDDKKLKSFQKVVGG